MFTIIVIFHIIICILLVGTVLLQQGKGAEIGAVFGSSEAIFGSSGPTTFLGKMTSVLAILFMITSLTLTYLASQKGTGSIMQNLKTPVAPAPISAPINQESTAKKGKTAHQQPASPEAGVHGVRDAGESKVNK